MAFDISVLTTIEWIVAAIGAVLMFMYFSKSAKTKKAAQGMMFVGIGLLAIGFVLPTFGTSLLGSIDLGFGDDATATIGTTTGGFIAASSCNVEDTTVTLSGINKFTAAAVGGNHRYKVGNAPGLTVSDTGTFTASPGDQLNLLWMNEAGNYFGVKETVTVPCSGTATFSKELVQNGTLTVEVFNEEGNLIDTAGENETMGVGDVVTLSANLKGTYQRGYPHGGVIVAEFNGTGTSAIDDVIVDFGGSTTSVPSIYAITLGTNARTKAFTVPAIMSNQILAGSILIDADDTNQPLVTGSDVILTFYPNDYFINENTGGSHDGPTVVDEDDSQTMAHTTSFTLNLD